MILVATRLYWVRFHSIDDPGEFGNMFGGLNAVFSGLAFAGVIITIFMHREELELTRKELKKTADAQIGSHNTLIKQLSEMKLVTKIEAVQSFINSHSDKDNSHNREAAKMVLAKLTEKVFEEHEKILLPRINDCKCGRILTR